LERSLAAASNPCDPSCDPPTWCGAATTLCAGEEETPSLVEKLRSGFRPGGRERRWRCTRLGVLWALAFACRHRHWWRSARRRSEEPRCPVDVGVCAEPRYMT